MDDKEGQQNLALPDKTFGNLPEFSMLRKVTEGKMDDFLAKTIPQTKEVLLQKKTTENPIRRRQLQTEIVRDYLNVRKEIYGEDQVEPLGEVEDFQDVDTFIVVKVHNEAGTIAKALETLVDQEDFDLSRLAIVVVDNNSTDSSAENIDEFIRDNPSKAKIMHIKQPRQGAGHTGRVGSDRALATLAAVANANPQSDILDTGSISFVDADCTFEKDYLATSRKTMGTNNQTEAVVPIFSYNKLTELDMFSAYTGSETPEQFIGRGGIKDSEKWKFHASIGYESFVDEVFEQGFIPNELVVAPETRHGSGPSFRPWIIAGSGGIIQPEENGQLIFGEDYDIGRRIKALQGPISLIPKVLGTTQSDRILRLFESTYNKNAEQYNNPMTATPHSDINVRTAGEYTHLKSKVFDMVDSLRDYPDIFWKDMFPDRMRTIFRFIARNAVLAYTKQDDALRLKASSFLQDMFHIDEVKLEEELRKQHIFPHTDMHEADADKAVDQIITQPEFFKNCLGFYEKVMQSYFERNNLGENTNLLTVVE